jgi:hypothetical protein
LGCLHELTLLQQGRELASLDDKLDSRPTVLSQFAFTVSATIIRFWLMVPAIYQFWWFGRVMIFERSRDLLSGHFE